jgi:hypothetical protein
MDHLTSLADDIRSAYARTQYGRAEWIEGTIELASLLADARRQFDANIAFAHWIVDAQLEDINHMDRAALIAMADNLDLARIILQETTRVSWRHIWAEEMKPRFSQVAKTTTQNNKTDESPHIDAKTYEIERSIPALSDNSENKIEPKPASRAGNIEKIIGDDAAYIRAWFTISKKGDLARGIAKVQSYGKGAKPLLAAIAATIKSGECVHAPVASTADFDIRMAFPHIPEAVARARGQGRSWDTLRKKQGNGQSDWDRFAELNDICKAKSDYCREIPAPNGKAYRLRDDLEEVSIGQNAWRWWINGVWPGEHPKLQVHVNPAKPEIKPEAEAVYFGKVLWPLEAREFTMSEEKQPTKDDLENTYWFVEELHRAMAGRGFTHTAIARYLRNWAKYVEKQQKPVACAKIMRDMAEGLDIHAANPDRNLDLQHKIPSRPIKFAQES